MIGDFPNLNIQQGWQCPRCSKINAPWLMQCPCPASINPQPYIGTPIYPPLYPYTTCDITGAAVGQQILNEEDNNPT